MKVIEHRQFKGIYVIADKNILLTKNLAPGIRVYGEDFVRDNGVEYRKWDINKSKLGAGIAKGISQIGIKPGSMVLYLGCASGTTASHVSDIVGEEGFVFAVDFAPRVLRDIVRVCQQRNNMCPIMADANNTDVLMLYVLECDAVFQDIAQKNQVEIFLKNCGAFLKEGGFGILAVKARSIDVARKPKQVFKEVIERLEKDSSIIIVDQKELEPYEKDHWLVVVKKR